VGGWIEEVVMGGIQQGTYIASEVYFTSRELPNWYQCVIGHPHYVISKFWERRPILTNSY